MSIREQSPTPVWSEAEIDRLLAIPSPPPSPLSIWSSPLPQIPSPPLPVSPPFPVSSPPLPASPTYPLGYSAAMIWLRAKTPSTSHPLPSGTPPSGTPPLLPIPLPTPSPPLTLPSMSHRADVLEVTLPPRKRMCIALGLRYKVGESSFAAAARPNRGFRADYGFVATLDDEVRHDLKRDVVGMPGPPATDDTELGRRMTNFATTKMAPKRTTRSTPATTSTTTTTVPDAQLKALIDQGVANALAASDADRSRNGEDSHVSGMGVRRQAPPAREPNGEALRKCILIDPYKPTTVLVQAVEATDDSSAIPEHTTVETPMNMSPENKAHFLAEKEAIHLILTGIGDEFYSTIDACQTGHEMWEAIE
nr:hypothetical protein [Tanacetum cinerariifolium]